MNATDAFLSPLVTTPNANPALVHLSNVHLSFGANEVLKGIDVQVRRGEAVSVIGPSGSGKSTILRCITGLLRPQQGEIRVGDTRVDTLRTEAELIALRKRVGFVFQQYNLFPHLTVLENLVIAPTRVVGRDRSSAVQEARALLEKVRLAHKENAYPGELSGGQQQRVAIARALVNNPAVILADEPTGNLDTRTSFEILVLFQKLHAEGRTLIFVTHNPEIAQYSSRNIRLRDGHVVEDTINPQILSAAAALAALPKNDED